MNTKRALIIDDELNARAAIKGMISENFPEVELVGEAKDLPEGVKLIYSLQPDIVFLDIEMPGYSGLEILDFFAKDQINFKIIFVTAYNEYALNAFELSAVDYLVKPLQLDDLKRALKKLDTSPSQALEALRSNLSKDEPKKILINASGGYVFVNVEDILYIKADGSYSDIIMTGGDHHYVTKRIAEFERLQEMGNFLRIHRSQIINVDHIAKISRIDGGTVIMSNGDELSISKEKRAELEIMISKYKI
jgi:two-component system, LytTR family, response regulator